MAAIAPISTMANTVSSAGSTASSTTQGTSTSASSPATVPGPPNTLTGPDASGVVNPITTSRRKLSISTTNLPSNVPTINLNGARTFNLPRETDTPRNPTTARRASRSQGQRPEMLANIAPPAQLNGALPRNGEREGGSDCTAWCVVA
ncbi:hypothetical protein EV715DRAFT_290331 [Schizophyllum commune]